MDATGLGPDRILGDRFRDVLDRVGRSGDGGKVCERESVTQGGRRFT